MTVWLLHALRTRGARLVDGDAGRVPSCPGAGQIQCSGMPGRCGNRLLLGQEKGGPGRAGFLFFFFFRAFRRAEAWMEKKTGPPFSRHPHGPRSTWLYRSMEPGQRGRVRLSDAPSTLSPRRRRRRVRSRAMGAEPDAGVVPPGGTRPAMPSPGSTMEFLEQLAERLVLSWLGGWKGEGHRHTGTGPRSSEDEYVWTRRRPWQSSADTGMTTR